MQLSFVRREELAPAIWEYYFRPERPLDFVPGQFVDVVLPGVQNDPRGASRVYTLTSQPSDELASFVVKIPEPHSPHKQALIDLASGELVQFHDAMGDLILPKDPSRPLVFVGGGIAIASYASMLKYLIARKEERPIFVFYALRTRHEAILRDLFKSYPLMLNMLTIAPNRLSAQMIVDATPPDAQIYLSGSEKFVEGLRTNLEILGKPRADIVFDFFDGYKEL